MTAKEFREYAEEHFGWAKTARSAKERQTFLQMAQAWRPPILWEAVNGIAPIAPSIWPLANSPNRCLPRPLRSARRMICYKAKLGRHHGRRGLAAEPWPWKV